MQTFIINGEPTAKGRPRFTKRGHTYTPKKTKDYEDSIEKQLIEQGAKPFTKEIEAQSQQEFLLKLVEAEVTQREEKKLNQLLKQSTLPTVSGESFLWDDIQLPSGITKDFLLQGDFLKHKTNINIMSAFKLIIDHVYDTVSEEDILAQGENAVAANKASSVRSFCSK